MQEKTSRSSPGVSLAKTVTTEVGDGEDKTMKKDDVMKEKETETRTFKRQPRNKEKKGENQPLHMLEKKKGASDMDLDTEEENKKARRDDVGVDGCSDVLNAGSHGRSREQK